MSEHCPNWAKELWEEYVCLTPRAELEKTIPIYNIDDSWSIVSQLVAEWLELNQIEYINFKENTLPNNCTYYPIRFFSDKVK